MKDVCVLIGWQRPEYMELCLGHIVDAELSENLSYLCFLDAGFDQKYLEILDKFPYELTIVKRERSSFKLGKQSYNVISGLLSAAVSAKDMVFYVEEDIFIGKDFFKYHYAVHEQQPNIMCSIASKCNDSGHDTTDDKGAYYIGSESDYQCWGTAWKKDMIIERLHKHHLHSYYSNPVGYIVKTFPNNFLGSRFCEQDGLTRREMMDAGLRCAFPHVPRAYHAGFYGYNRLHRKHKDYDVRLNNLKVICYDKELMKRESGKYWQDSIPVDLNINENKFHYGKA